MPQPAPLYIVTSPRPRTGKTLLARLLMEFFLASGRPLVGFDLNPRDQALAERFRRLVWPVDISETRGQMELFDRLIADTASTKVIDLGYAPFDQFFAVVREIGFVAEARRRQIEPIVLFMSDPTASTARSYGELQSRIGATFVPVHNESVSLMFAKEDYPPTRAECGVIHIPRLSPIVRGVIDRPSFSFNAHMANMSNGPTEVHGWIGNLYAELRDFELRLLLGRLSFNLRAASIPPEKRKGAQAR
jgi:hypothetical protein